MSLVPLTNGRAHIVFDPRLMPHGDQPAQMSFEAKDDDLAAAWQVDQDRDVHPESADPAAHGKRR